MMCDVHEKMDLRELAEQGTFKGEIKSDQSMAEYTSLRIGGPADVIVMPDDIVSLKNALAAARMQKIPVAVIGSGTNLLVRDGGIRGVVVSMSKIRKIEHIQNIHSVAPSLAGPGGPARSILYVEAGRSLGDLVGVTARKGLSGIESLAGIPGSVGGAIRMNAGSYGTEMKDVVLGIACMSLDGVIMNLESKEIGFSYRNTGLREDLIILSTSIVFMNDRPERVSARIRSVLQRKKETQPLGSLSAGCVFKNPEGDSAGRLIESAGCKGMSVGGVEVSPLHANYFINRGGATCKDFLFLMDDVRERVRKSTGVLLLPEIKVIGTADREEP